MIRVAIEKKISLMVFIGFSLSSILSVFCFGMASVMAMDTSIPMDKVQTAILSCTDTQNNICVMSIANHIDQLGSAFFGIFQPPIVSVFALAALLAASAIRLQRTRQEELWRHRLRLQQWRSAILKPFNSIFRALSQGILHSQIYA